MAFGDDEKLNPRDMLYKQLTEKYGLDQRNQVVEENKTPEGFNWRAFGAGIGTSLQGKGAQGTTDLLDRQAKEREGNVNAFDKSKTGLLSDIDANDKMTATGQEQDLFKRENDMASEDSRMIQGLASKMMPSTDWSNYSAAQIKKMIPSIDSIYKTEQASRENAFKRQDDLNKSASEAAMKKKEVDIKGSSDLRKEYNNNPIVKDTQDIQQAFGKIQKNAENVSAAGDLSLITNYMKMLDPGSTVREGEFANAQNSGGVPDTVRARYNQVVSGERLSSAQRADFLGQSKNIFDSQLERLAETNNRYQSLADKYGMDSQDILMNVKPAEIKGVKKSKPKTIVQNGHTYTLDEKTGEYK